MSALPATVPEGIADRELAARVAAGDGAAFELLMRRHNRRLYRIARSVLRDDADAEDALQES
jgi:RNA polymerase sigma-70 factor (ECF subfamily)